MIAPNLTRTISSPMYVHDVLALADHFGEYSPVPNSQRNQRGPGRYRRRTYLRLAISSGVGTWVLILAPLAATWVFVKTIGRTQAEGSASTGSYCAYCSSCGVCCFGMCAAPEISAGRGNVR